MNTITVDVRDLPGKLSELLNLAANGAEVILLDGTTKAKLSPPAKREWKLGLHPGAMKMRDDFTEPMDEETFLRGGT